MIQHTTWQSIVLISWLDLYLRSIETFWKASSVQEKLKSSDFASSTEVVGKICNVQCFVIRGYELVLVHKICLNFVMI